jgi:serine/threonine-protein kinase
MSAKAPELDAGAAVPGTRYKVVKALGAGGMGFVYHVVKPPNIQGVLKLMSPELTRHEELRLRFFDEVRILAQLDHPNIVKVFDYDALPDGTPFYVMELLSGRTVRDVLNAVGRVPPRVAYEITRQLLEALQAAHTHEVPVIHRDIKPENIFLHVPRHGEPVVKLIDFGVSAVGDRKHDGTFVGTWSYASPEQIRGAPPTPATDIYATGLVLYEMLAGVGPFDHHDDWVKISKAQLGEIPAPVTKFAPWAPPSIVALLEAALDKDPARRPRDAYAFSERLYELERANDGGDARAEGPLDLARRDTEAGAPEGPLAKVLTQVEKRATARGARAAVEGPRARRVSIVLAGLVLIAGATAAAALVARGRGSGSTRGAASASVEPATLGAPTGSSESERATTASAVEIAPPSAFIAASAMAPPLSARARVPPRSSQPGTQTSATTAASRTAPPVTSEFIPEP